MGLMWVGQVECEVFDNRVYELMIKQAYMSEIQWITVLAIKLYENSRIKQKHQKSNLEYA